MKKKLLEVILRCFDVPVCYKMEIDGVLVVPPNSIVMENTATYPTCIMQNNTVDGVFHEGLRAVKA